MKYSNIHHFSCQSRFSNIVYVNKYLMKSTEDNNITKSVNAENNNKENYVEIKCKYDLILKRYYVELKKAYKIDCIDCIIYTQNCEHQIKTNNESAIQSEVEYLQRENKILKELNEELQDNN